MEVCTGASWAVIGSGPVDSTQGMSQTGMLGWAATPMAQLDAATAELRQRVIMFNAGDEKYSAPWLTQFQRMEGAWQVCAQALQGGPGASCDEELLQEFCAQTIGRLSRTFGVRHPESTQQTLREELELLLLQHADGRPPVWRQLTLALTAADFWLGTVGQAWCSTVVSVPDPVSRELMSLPAELLFCDRALPLDNPKLRQAAAAALLDAWPQILPLLLSQCSMDADAMAADAGNCLRIVASWLRVLRKCLRALPTRDEAEPLKCMAENMTMVIALSDVAPSEGAEAAQQVARWRCCHNELAALLSPWLDSLFLAEFENGRQTLLPLLADLASDCWPRATLNELDLNWRTIAEQCVQVTREAIEAATGNLLTGEDSSQAGDLVDAEAALDVWQTFAETLRTGVQELALPAPVLAQDERESFMLRAPAEKRSRTMKTWHPSRETIAKSEGLPTLFSGLASQLLELLIVPPFHTEDALATLWELRRTTRTVLDSWASLVGDSPSWQEATWTPLTRVAGVLMSNGAAQDEDVWRETEVVFWFCSALAAKLPDDAGSVPVACAVQELSVIDLAPAPWRALLWASASGLAATAPAERCSAMVEWVLHRSPMEAGSHELISLTELPYAEALEKLCRNLSKDKAHIEYGERLVALAFGDRPQDAIHDDTAKVQSTLLSAMRHAMGINSELVCQGLGSTILPRLQEALDNEAMSQEDQTWLAAQAFFATLATAVPVEMPTGVDSSSHPAIILWQNSWPYVKNALLVWPVNSTSDQPQLAAAEALVVAIRAFPSMLPSGVQLLVESASKAELPTLQLKTLQKVIKHAPGTGDVALKAAEMLSATVLECCDSLFARLQALLESPELLAALYDLLGEAIRPSPPGSSGLGPCDDRLRPLLLAQPLRFAGRALEFIARALPECVSQVASGSMLRFLANMLSPDEGERIAAHQSVTIAALPELCGALCCALASQEHLAELDGLMPAAEVLWYASDAFPAEMPAALAKGLPRVAIPEWSRVRLPQHIASRAEWPRRSEWLENLQQIVQEWQREMRQVTL